MGDAVRVLCPKCEAGYDVPASATGKPTRCKKCGERFTVSSAPTVARRPTREQQDSDDDYEDDDAIDSSDADRVKWANYRRVMMRAARMVYWTMWLVWMLIFVRVGLEVMTWLAAPPRRNQW